MIPPEVAHMEPQLARVRGGWAAVGRWFAVHGATKEEAISRFHEAEKKVAEILARPERDATKQAS